MFDYHRVYVAMHLNTHLVLICVNHSCKRFVIEMSTYLCYIDIYIYIQYTYKRPNRSRNDVKPFLTQISRFLFLQDCFIVNANTRIIAMCKWDIMGCLQQLHTYTPVYTSTHMHY